MDTIDQLIQKVFKCAYTVRTYLMPGFKESVYKNAMYIELKDAGLKVDTEVEFNVNYRGHVIGTFRADLIVEGRLILELKAVESLQKSHEVQLVNYPTITGIDDGLLINFGEVEQLGRKRKYRVYNPHNPLSKDYAKD